MNSRTFTKAAAAATLAVLAAPALTAELSEAELYFELNDTDGDLGLHSSIDGGPYMRLLISDPGERRLLTLYAAGQLARQGMTQFFLESAEPSFDELAPEAFFNRFPAGEYEIEALTADGHTLEAEVQLSHVMAAPPGNVKVNGKAAAEDCDAQNLPTVKAPVFVDWDRVTRSHPEIGDSGRVQIARYQFFAEREGEDFKLAVDLPPTVTQFEVPAELLQQPGRIKYEIIARTSTGNNTAIENCFVLERD